MSRTVYHSPQYQLTSWSLDSTQQGYVVQLLHLDSNAIESFLASSLSRNVQLIQQLSPEDANRIGYMAGLSDALSDDSA